MADPFLAEVRLMSFNFPPKGWAQCNGQFLPINQNQALFSLLGTTYGGNGQTTFALPDLRGRVPISFGAGFVQGQVLGEQAHTLTQNEMPAHTHQVMASPTIADQPVPTNNVLATASFNIYAAPAGNPLVTMNPLEISSVGGSQAHNNMQPYLVIEFCIALQGIFPSRN